MWRFIKYLILKFFMEDKFILMGLNDKNSKYVADALKSKTCKKILDLLAETKEASEKDISDALDMPINTIEYNLKKLIKSKLVEKTKNFFWSVKGKKIDMYKLARKHIIISPNKTPSLSYLKQILPIVFISGIFLIFIKYILQISFLATNAGSVKSSLEATATLITEPQTSISLLDKLLMLPYWSWFLIGASLGIIIIFLIRKYKSEKFIK